MLDHTTKYLLETSRLRLRNLSHDDAEFLIQLLNDEAFIRYIGDKGVRTVDDARDYVTHGPAASYARFGFGLYLVELKSSAPIGICGLVKRDALDDVDIGFAFLRGFRSQGYAYEAAAAVLGYGRDILNLHKIVAIVSPGNHASIRLLEKLGMRFERAIELPGQVAATQLFVPRLTL